MLCVALVVSPACPRETTALEHPTAGQSESLTLDGMKRTMGATPGPTSVSGFFQGGMASWRLSRHPRGSPGPAGN